MTARKPPTDKPRRLTAVKSSPAPAAKPRARAAKSRTRVTSPVNRNSDKELDKLLVEHTPDIIEPGYDGFLKRVMGYSWQEVADEIGSPSPMAAMRTVSLYMQRAAAAMSAQQQQEAMQISVARYETMVRNWWVKGNEGQDVAAAGILLRAMERLDRVNRLTEGDVVITRETLVISANPEEYTAQLREVVEQRELEAAAEKKK